MLRISKLVIVAVAFGALAPLSAYACGGGGGGYAAASTQVAAAPSHYGYRSYSADPYRAAPQMYYAPQDGQQSWQPSGAMFRADSKVRGFSR